MNLESARNGPENDSLRPKQKAAALALAAGHSQEEASREFGAGTRMIKTWLATQSTFPWRIPELCSEMTVRALDKLVEGMVSAAETLGFLCREGKSEMVRLSAARAVLELATKIRETVELEERIAALEGRRKIA